MPQRIKEPSRDIIHLHQHAASAGRGFLAFDEHASLKASAKRPIARDRRVDNARQRANAIDQLLMKDSLP